MMKRKTSEKMEKFAGVRQQLVGRQKVVSVRMRAAKKKRYWWLLLLILLLGGVIFWWRKDTKTTDEKITSRQQEELKNIGVDDSGWLPDAIVEDEQLSLEMKFGN